MRAVDIIIKKRDKKELTGKEISFFIAVFQTEASPITRHPPWLWPFYSTA
jgi:thymidine phosphorylase